MLAWGSVVCGRGEVRAYTRAAAKASAYALNSPTGVTYLFQRCQQLIHYVVFLVKETYVSRHIHCSAHGDDFLGAKEGFWVCSRSQG